MLSSADAGGGLERGHGRPRARRRPRDRGLAALGRRRRGRRPPPPAASAGASLAGRGRARRPTSPSRRAPPGCLGGAPSTGPVPRCVAGRTVSVRPSTAARRAARSSRRRRRGAREGDEGARALPVARSATTFAPITLPYARKSSARSFSQNGTAGLASSLLWSCASNVAIGRAERRDARALRFHRQVQARKIRPAGQSTLFEPLEQDASAPAPDLVVAQCRAKSSASLMPSPPTCACRTRTTPTPSRRRCVARAPPSPPSCSATRRACCRRRA